MGGEGGGRVPILLALPDSVGEQRFSTAHVPSRDSINIEKGIRVRVGRKKAGEVLLPFDWLARPLSHPESKPVGCIGAGVDRGWGVFGRG